MVYEYHASDPKHYAQGLRYNSERRTLLWEVAPGHDTLLVQTPFGQSAEEGIDELCRRMGQLELGSGVFIQVMPGIYVRYITAKEKARDNGCPLNAEVCSYAIFACMSNGERCDIYAPLNNPMNPVVYHAPKEIHIDVAPEMKTVRRGPFRREEVFSGYHRITFPKNYDKSYVYGNLHYRVDKYTIPITPMMFEAGTVYVKCSERPTIVSSNRGLKLI